MPRITAARVWLWAVLQDFRDVFFFNCRQAEIAIVPAGIFTGRKIFTGRCSARMMAW